MPKYNLDTEWDDPFDHLDDRRNSPRFQSNMRIMIGLESGSARRNLVGPGLLRDMSEGGLCCLTKHRLVPGNEVTLRFTTEMCPAEMCLPKTFYGPAKVVRTLPDSKDRMVVGLEFGEPFKQNMEFALYLQQLETAAIAN